MVHDKRRARGVQRKKVVQQQMVREPPNEKVCGTSATSRALHVEHWLTLVLSHAQSVDWFPGKPPVKI